MLTDGRGVPLSIVVTGANRHDASQLAEVLDGIVIDRQSDGVVWLYADKGYDGEPAKEAIKSRGYRPRVARKKPERGRPPKDRRWVVEAAHSWLNRFRKLLVRYEKTADSYLALLSLASSIICFRKVGVIYG